MYVRVCVHVCVCVSLRANVCVGWMCRAFGNYTLGLKLGPCSLSMAVHMHKSECVAMHTRNSGCMAVHAHESECMATHMRNSVCMAVHVR